MTQAQRRWLAWTAAAVLLAAVAASYFSPDMVVDLANRVWSCF